MKIHSKITETIKLKSFNGATYFQTKNAQRELFSNPVDLYEFCRKLKSGLLDELEIYAVKQIEKQGIYLPV